MISEYDHALWIEGGEVVEQGSAGKIAQAYTQAMLELGERDDLADITG